MIRKLCIAACLMLMAVAARAERWVPKDSTDKSIRVVLTSSATGAPATGLTVTDIDVYVWREGATVTAKFDCTDLGSENAAHSNTGCYEGGALGIYRIDLPDTAWATGADYVDIAVVHADCITAFVHVALTGVDPNDSTPAVDVTEVSGDATAANSLEAILDGTGVASDVDITMRSLTITHDAGTAVDIAGQIGMHVEGTGDPWGWAVYLEGGNMGNGLYVLGGDEASAVKFSASNATGYHGLELYGMGSGSGLYAWTSIMGGQGYGILASSFKGNLEGNITGNLSGSVGTCTTLTNWHASVTDWTDGGRLDTIIDAILVDTGTTLPATLATILADTNELQGNQGNWATATGFSTHSAADTATALKASTGWEVGSTLSYATVIKRLYSVGFGKMTYDAGTVKYYDSDGTTLLGTFSATATGRTPQ